MVSYKYAQPTKLRNKMFLQCYLIQIFSNYFMYLKAGRGRGEGERNWLFELGYPVCWVTPQMPTTARSCWVEAGSHDLSLSLQRGWPGPPLPSGHGHALDVDSLFGLGWHLRWCRAFSCPVSHLDGFSGYLSSQQCPWRTGHFVDSLSVRLHRD